MTLLRLGRFSLPFVVIALTLAACGGETPSSDAVDSNDTVAPAPGADTVQQTVVPVDTTPPGPREVTPIDPGTGTMTITVDGKATTFKDVNGSIDEKAGGGETVARLQLEGHDDPVHFKIRLGG